MALNTVTVPPLDPYGFTGPVRVMSGPARMQNVSPDTAYGEFARWLYVGTSGDISMVLWDGTTQLLRNVPVGLWPFYTIMINAAGTTASELVWGS